MSNCPTCDKPFHANEYHNRFCNYCNKKFHKNCMEPDFWDEYENRYIEPFNATSKFKDSYICMKCFKEGKIFDEELQELTEKYEEAKEEIRKKWSEYCKINML